MPATTYCGTADLNRLLESFISDYYGTTGYASTGTVWDDMQACYNRVNERLDGMGRFTSPIGTQTDGRYPQQLIDWQGCLVIYEKIASRHLSEFERVPEWVQDYNIRATAIEELLEQGAVLFKDELAISEVGISAPSIVATTGFATLYNNYDDPRYPYLGDDVLRTYRVVIDGTGAGNAIGQATFKWSMDNGVSWESSNQTSGTEFKELNNNVWISWQPARGLTGTQRQLEINDQWSFTCRPLSKKTYGGGNTFQVRTFERG